MINTAMVLKSLLCLSVEKNKVKLYASFLQNPIIDLVPAFRKPPMAQFFFSESSLRFLKFVLKTASNMNL
jgi:hypothetical protein